MADESGGSDDTSAKPPSAAPAPKSRRPTVVPLPLKREVSAPHLEQLRASWLDDETIVMAELYTEQNQRALTQILDRPYPRACGPALVIPFYLPGATEPYGYRIKPTNPRTEKRRGKARQIKYDQSARVGVLVYYAPRARASGGYSDLTRPCIFTEGEKKALALDRAGYVCVGLTGVWNWSDPGERDATGGDKLHPLITEHVAIAGREVVICFDADARDNPQVMHAASRLCGLLLSAGAARVLFVCPPAGGPKGIDDYLAARGPEATQALLAAAEVMEGVDPKRPRPRIRVIKAFADAPIDKEAVIPDGYDLRDDGSLWRMSTSEKSPDVLVSGSPLFLQRQFIDHDSAQRRVALCFREGKAWISLEISRLALADPRLLITELGSFGPPVHGGNAVRTAEWLHLYEIANTDCIPKTTSVSRVGWHVVERPIFVVDQPILPEGHGVEVVVDSSGHRREIFAALRPVGGFEAHRDALRQAWSASRICAAMICGALSTPLLFPLHAPNFAIHLIGESSRGKTSMLKVASSVYGDPANPRWLAAWNATNVGAELRAAALCDLPQCYDEVGGGDLELLQKMIYSIINGTGRTRGQRDATMRDTLSWRTVVLSTGERELADESTATGAQVRVVQFHVDGFGDLDGAQVDGLCAACAANAGSFGQQWVELLVDQADWPGWREVYANYIGWFRDQASDPLQGRIASYFALLQIAEQMAWELGLSERGSHVIADLFADVRSRVAVEGLAERARRYVQDWVESDPDGFPELTPAAHGDVGAPARPGLRLQGYRRIDGTLLLIPSQFREFCKRYGLSHTEVVRQWAARDWVDTEPGRLEKRQRLNGKQSRFIIVRPTPEDLE